MAIDLFKLTGGSEGDVRETITHSIMTMSKLLSKAAARAASTSTAAQTTKAAGDISSVFPSLRPDYQPEPLPPRFGDLKRRLFEKNEKALTESWKRLLPSLEKEVDKIRTKGSDVCVQPLYSILCTCRS
jgi:hypothetical protein